MDSMVPMVSLDSMAPMVSMVSMVRTVLSGTNAERQRT
jgi:hypothetical protein